MYLHFLALFAMYGDIFFKCYESKSFLFPTATNNVKYKTDLGVTIFSIILGWGSGSPNTENTRKYRSSIVLNTENVQYRNFNTIEY